MAIPLATVAANIVLASHSILVSAILSKCCLLFVSDGTIVSLCRLLVNQLLQFAIS
jgi:hypothetical protein